MKYLSIYMDLLKERTTVIRKGKNKEIKNSHFSFVCVFFKKNMAAVITNKLNKTNMGQFLSGFMTLPKVILEKVLGMDEIFIGGIQ